jgi:hypothetical protein
MKLISVLIKLLSAKSKLSSVFVLKLDDVLANLEKVARDGGTLVLRIGLNNGEITLEDSVELPEFAEEKSLTEKAIDILIDEAKAARVAKPKPAAKPAAKKTPPTTKK